MAAARRKRPRVAADHEDSADENSLTWARTSVLDNGLIRPKPKSTAEVLKIHPDPNVASEALYGLNTLQQREDTPVNDTALLSSLQTMASYLPPEVQDQVYFGEQPGEAAEFSPFRDEAEWAKDLNRRWRSSNAFFRNARLGPYLFWPINTGPVDARAGTAGAGPDHYVTLIAVLRQNPDDLKKHQEAERAKDPQADPSEWDAHDPVAVPYREVVQWSIVDPKRGDVGVNAKQADMDEARRHIRRVDSVRHRAQRILERGGIAFDFATEWRVSGTQPAYALPWVPPQTDAWSSGLRAFALIKKQCDAVVEFHCAETAHDDAVFWARSSGWLNPHQVRHEMMGLLAVHCIDDLGWKARVAIEPIGAIDGIKDRPKFPAQRLRMRHIPPAYVPQNDIKGADLVRISRGYKKPLLLPPVWFQNLGGDGDGDDHGDGDDDGDGDGDGDGHAPADGDGDGDATGDGDGDGDATGDGDGDGDGDATGDGDGDAFDDDHGDGDDNPFADGDGDGDTRGAEKPPPRSFFDTSASRRSAFPESAFLRSTFPG
ncbi:hypothetical protein SLS62_000439 [Diatrype stigma]|uniref:Uncharacterized protein n=1 Tax=Diatrype stigma TaxID=117547 RepID=A0AAN9UXL7_9PEZI